VLLPDSDQVQAVGFRTGLGRMGQGGWRKAWHADGLERGIEVAVAAFEKFTAFRLESRVGAREQSTARIHTSKGCAAVGRAAAGWPDAG
jgi:hypothetical protein